MRVVINAFKEETTVLDLFAIVDKMYPIYNIGYDAETAHLTEVRNMFFTLTDFMDIDELTERDA